MGRSQKSRFRQSGADLKTQPNAAFTGDPARAPFNSEELVRVKAYELYEKRGRIDGHDVEDWLRAEAEIRDTVRKQAA